ncbi:putative DNA primase/helicase [Ectothiorhodospira magna]|uniref:Putative DNA primase/helicase n=1 Tax=Ectothiorhodospira magna TaxID=867345 RepID=A0A1H9CJG7_9GAMM|nr:YfjI family protein [Ectothiorhodospira magna]SEQ01304.1 putative DNA primase/helicase [Ectothiorhodospira magna]
MPRDIVIDIPRREAAPDWPEPQPLPDGLPPVPAMDQAMLPEALRPWLADIAERMQCPLEYPAVGGVVALSSVVGRQIGIRPRLRDDWTVVPNLWGAIVGRPGLMKSPALSESMKLLQGLEAAARQDYEQAQQDYEIQAQLDEAGAKATKKAIEAAMKKGNRQEAMELAQAAAACSGESPQRRRYITSDSTVEALGELLSSNPRGVLIFRDELTGWLKDLEREGREGSRAFYLESWNGNGGFTYDRIGRGTIDIESVCVSILGGIQPGRLLDYMRSAIDGGAGDDGLIQRFQLLVWPDMPSEYRDVDRWPDRDAKARARQAFERLDTIDPVALGAGQDEGGMPFLRFEAAAYERFVSWRVDLEDRIRRGEEHPAFESAISKQRSLVPSLALLFHLVDCPSGGPVSDHALLMALTWCDFLEEHARRIYSPAMDPAKHAARELDKRIRKGDLPSPFRERDVYRQGWRLLDRAGTRDALEYLEDLGRVRSVTVETGGRPTTEWLIHPKLAGGA